MARWLLMAHDCVDGDELPLSHEFLATMLGVRRAGITVAVGQLKEAGLIDNRAAASYSQSPRFGGICLFKP